MIRLGAGEFAQLPRIKIVSEGRRRELCGAVPEASGRVTTVSSRRARSGRRFLEGELKKTEAFWVGFEQ